MACKHLYRTILGCSGAVLLLAGCSAQSSSTLPAGTGPTPVLRHADVTPIQHVVIIVQENRTPDNLFACLPNSDTCPGYGLNSHGQHIPLKPLPLNWVADISHSHATFVSDYDHGKMDGFDHAVTTSKSCNRTGVCPYAYVPPSQVQPYFAMAQEYAFADRMFQTNEGPSFPAHLELVAGSARVHATHQGGPSSALDVDGNPGASIHGMQYAGGCDSLPGTLVPTIPLEPIGAPSGPLIFPCFNETTIATPLDHAGLTWRYYEKSLGAGLWKPFDAYRSIRYGPDYANVIAPSETVLADIAQGTLANVTWITPSGDNSDHSGNKTATGGPAWVSAIVNAIGQSPFWNSTAIFVVWDDWGGWYDHVPPPIIDNDELGMRVPLVVISPYTPAGYVSHVQHQFGSLLHFTEAVFNLPSLGTNDARSDDLMDCFDFSQQPRAFVPITAPAFHPSHSRSDQNEDP